MEFLIPQSTLHIQYLSGIISSTPRHVLQPPADRVHRQEVCVQFTEILAGNELLFQHQWTPWQIDVDFLLLSLHCWGWLDRGNPLYGQLVMCETAMQCQYVGNISHQVYFKGNYTVFYKSCFCILKQTFFHNIYFYYSFRHWEMMLATTLQQHNIIVSDIMTLTFYYQLFHRGKISTTMCSTFMYV